MTKDQLRERTKKFALGVLRLVENLPRNRMGEIVGRQLLRSGTSVAANYRAACRARSRREFVAKMGIVEEEADESAFWLEMIQESGLASAELSGPWRREASQLVAITVVSIRTARFGGRGSVARGSGARTANPQSAIRNPQCS
jgi:four helix bundle protein